MKKLLLLLIIPLLSFGQALTYVPDDNFEQELINLGYDDIIDNYVLTNNINTIVSLDISYSSISELIGIENFTSLEVLSINNNELTQIDLSQNINLIKLFCYENQLSQLNTNTNTNLQILECQSNLITSLSISENQSLETLYCGSNLLTTLDVSNNIQLLYLGFVMNQISEIILDINTNLINLNCHNNYLINLDISNNINLMNLDSHNNIINCIQVWDMNSAEAFEIAGSWVKDESATWSLDCQICSEDITACNYSPEGTQDCIYPIDLYGTDYLDCDGNCINDIDQDGVCDEQDNCVDVYNPNQEDFNLDEIGDACDGIGLNEDNIQKKTITVVDVLGREIDKENKDALLLYIYDDGSVQKKYVIE